jgi:hypothetical protein
MSCYTPRNEKMLLTFVLATAAAAFPGSSGDLTIKHIDPFYYFDADAKRGLP